MERRRDVATAKCQLPEAQRPFRLLILFSAIVPWSLSPLELSQSLGAIPVFLSTRRARKKNPAGKPREVEQPAAGHPSLLYVPGEDPIRYLNL